MIVYKVQTTERTKDFTPCVFVDTLAGVFVEAPGDGFFKHPTFTSVTLADHLRDLRKEGFKITKHVACV